MQPIKDANRRALRIASAMLCTIPLFLAPIAGRSSFELAGERATFNARFGTLAPLPSWKPRPLTLLRDPFVPETEATPYRRDTASATGKQATAPIVRAIVSGDVPRALLEVDGKVWTAGVGDSVAGSTILSIDRTGISLKNGDILTLPSGAR